jgi:hypothetical protein
LTCALGHSLYCFIALLLVPESRLLVAPVPNSLSITSPPEGISLDPTKLQLRTLPLQNGTVALYALKLAVRERFRGGPNGETSLRHANTALGHHRHEISMAQPVGDVPAEAQLDDFSIEAAAAVNGVSDNGPGH